MHSLIKTSCILIIFGLSVSGCSLDRRLADQYAETLTCGSPIESSIQYAKKFSASSMEESDGFLFISFNTEYFVLYLSSANKIIGAEREIFEYFPFWNGDEYTTLGMRVILTCNENKNKKHEI